MNLVILSMVYCIERVISSILLFVMTILSRAATYSIMLMDSERRRCIINPLPSSWYPKCWAMLTSTGASFAVTAQLYGAHADTNITL
jgi:hypothetical protein